jgi:uncharacterized protein YdaU (DUF1376 family)
VSSWFPFFGRDFLTATSGWTAEERGHYITLLIVQWEQKALVDDLARLELVSPGVTRCWEVVSEKFPLCSDGKRRNIRLEHERSKSQDRSERARQSASARWASEAVSGGDQTDAKPPPDANAMRTHMPEQCERICTSNAPMSMSMKGTSSSARACAWEELWPALRQAWNAGVGVKWRSSRPSETVKAALAEDGWMDLASKAIEHLPKCLYFGDPVTLNQFCKPGFVDEVLGGKWNNPKRAAKQGRDFGDAPPPPKVFTGEAAEAFERTRRKLAAAKEGI